MCSPSSVRAPYRSLQGRPATRRAFFNRRVRVPEMHPFQIDVIGLQPPQRLGQARISDLHPAPPPLRLSAYMLANKKNLVASTARSRCPVRIW